MKNFSGWFPFPTDYSSIDLRNDVFAGLTVGFLLVPQAIAYAILAGVPPVYGIYAALVPMLIYSLLGSTPHVSVGPTALAGILALSSLSGFAQPADPEYMRLIFLLAALTGVVQLLFGVLRLGVLVNFLSRPVISGFVSAAAVLIAFSQVKPLFGIDLPRTSYLHNTILAIGQNFGSIHGPTALASVLCIIALIVLRKWAPKWPGILLLLVAATFLTAFFRLDRIGLSILGQLPSGFPAFILPDFGSRDVLRLLPAALVLGLISFVETLSIAKTFSESFDYYRVDPNRELIALGSSKFIGSFFQAIPTSASFSRSAVSVRNGTRTMVSSLISIVLVAAATFITPWFYYLPLPLLAAIIILSVKGLFDWKEMVRLWRLDKKDFAVLAVTFLVTLFGGLQFGIAAGVLLSLAFFILKAARPHFAELGRLSGTNAFRNLERFPHAETETDILIVRLDAELFFGNAEYFRDRLEELVQHKGPELRLIILDAHTIHDLDSSGAYILRRLFDRFAKANIELYLCGTIGPVRDRLYRLGLMDRIGADRQFLSIQDALRYYRTHNPEDRDWDRPAVQHT